MLESQCRRLLAPHSHRFTTLTFTQTGTAMSNPPNQNAATVDFRIFAQAPHAEDLSPVKLFRPVGDNIMQAYPGGTFHLDLRQAFPKPVFEYYVTLLPQTAIRHRCTSGTTTTTRVVRSSSSSSSSSSSEYARSLHRSSARSTPRNNLVRPRPLQRWRGHRRGISGLRLGAH
ncbi:hypothetical protein KC315_g8633 [Hortaea werneckii]|nr:hypothetical protein KC315_g8633 [Hortaea werneckii]